MTDILKIKYDMAESAKRLKLYADTALKHVEKIRAITSGNDGGHLTESFVCAVRYNSENAKTELKVLENLISQYKEATK